MSLSGALPWASAAQPSSAATVGATSTSRIDSGATPSSRTPFPPITNGARAWTTPSEPCSPRWPPWSSQLWRAEWITHRSGVAGESNSWATGVERVRVLVVGAHRVLVRPLGVEAGELVGALVGQRVAALGGDHVVTRVATGEADRAVVGPRLVGTVAMEEHHVDDRLQRGVEQHVECRLRRRLVLGGQFMAHEHKVSARLGALPGRLLLWLAARAGPDSHVDPPAGSTPRPRGPQPRGLVCPRSNRAGDPVRTYTPTNSEITRGWHVIDAEGVVLGRLATEVATLLRGKHKPIFTPHADTGDHVVVVTRRGSRITPARRTTSCTAVTPVSRAASSPRTSRTLLARHPERVVQLAVRGMLPEEPPGPSDDQEAARVRAGPTHPHRRSAPPRGRRVDAPTARA